MGSAAEKEWDNRRLTSGVKRNQLPVGARFGYEARDAGFRLKARPRPLLRIGPVRPLRSNP